MMCVCAAVLSANVGQKKEAGLSDPGVAWQVIVRPGSALTGLGQEEENKIVRLDMQIIAWVTEK